MSSSGAPALPAQVTVVARVVSVLVKLGAVVVGIPLLDRWRVPRGIDSTGTGLDRATATEWEAQA